MASAIAVPSAAMQRRIASHLDAGVTPSVRGNRVMLRDIVLVRATGDRAPAAAEAERQAAALGINLDISFWNRERQALNTTADSVIAYDRSGIGHTVSRKYRGQRVVTKAGRRFYSEAPQTEWIIHLPVVYRRTRPGSGVSYFNPRTLDMTEDMMLAYFDPESPEYGLLQLLRTRDGADQDTQVQRMMAEWSRLFPPDKIIPNGWEYRHKDPNVELVVSNRGLSYSAQTTGITRSGERTVDTFLDQIVFGMPITGFNLWQVSHLHETSRRRNHECGIDVIVAAATRRSTKGGSQIRNKITADEAAQELVSLAKEHFPDSSLANYEQWEAPLTQTHDTLIHRIKLDLKNRNLVGDTPLKDQLRVYLTKMRKFLAKPKTFAEIVEGINKGNIYRKNADGPAPSVSLIKVLNMHMTWTHDKLHRLLLFLCMFPEEFVALPSDAGFVNRTVGDDTVCADSARKAIKHFGTPVRLLELFFRKLGARILLLQGDVCRYAHVPEDWEGRSAQDKTTVVLNVWNKHVFTYTRAVANIPLVVRQPKHHDYKLISLRAEDDDRSEYEKMVEFDWADFASALQRKAVGTIFWTTERIDLTFLKGLDHHNVSYIPRWSSFTECRAVFVSFGNKKQSVLIKRVPGNHKLLSEFCKTVMSSGRKLHYGGESAGVIAHRFMQTIMRRNREVVSAAVTTGLLERQDNKCGGCNDLLKKFECHHKKPVAAGGTDDPDNLVLLCPPCHAQETERQEQANCRHNVWFESRLCPRMHELFELQPLPKTIHWGDQERQAEAHRNEFTPVKCLDIVGCRSNFFLERTRDIPVGCPLDQLEPVFVDGKYDLDKFEWILVDVFEQGEDGDMFQDVPDAHRLYDGPHLYPLETVKFLIDDGFLKPSATTMPLGWAPIHRRPACELRDALGRIRSTWEMMPLELFKETDDDTMDDLKRRRENTVKHMILAMIGVWSTQRREQLACYRTACEEDVPGEIETMTYTDDCNLAWKTTSIIDTRSMLPLALQCRFQEALLMERAARLIERIPRIVPLAARVDGIYFSSSHADAVTELEALASRHQYSVTERPVFKMKEADWGCLPINVQSWDYRIANFQKSAKWFHSTNRKYEKCGVKYKLWKPEDDLDEREKALRTILHAGGALVTGPAGVGKSVLLKKLREELVRRGETVHVCAYTHAAARLIGGVTMAHLLHLDVKLHRSWIIVDEISLCPIDTLGQLSRIQFAGAKFVLFGDFEGQFEPMRDRWDVPYSLVPESVMIGDMCKHMHIHLTEYLRGPDHDLFNFYHGLYTTKETLRESIIKAQAAYPIRVTSPFDFDMIMCISHANRKICNARLNEHKAIVAEASGKKTCLLEWQGEDIKGATSQPQTMIIWEGIELVGCPRGTGKTCNIVQGVVYTVVKLHDSEVVLQMRSEYCAKPKKDENESATEKQDETDDAEQAAPNQVTVAFEDVTLLLRLTHAMCYYTCQGRSFDRGRKTLMLDTDHPYFTRRALIVGMSRVRHGEDLHIADSEYSACVTGRNRKTFRRI